jgi:hypothetical protein
VAQVDRGGVKAAERAGGYVRDVEPRTAQRLSCEVLERVLDGRPSFELRRGYAKLRRPQARKAPTPRQKPPHPDKDTRSGQRKDEADNKAAEEGEDRSRSL